MKVKGNRIILDNGYIQIKVCIDEYSGLPDAKFIVMGLKGLHRWQFDTLEEAWEKVNER